VNAHAFNQLAISAKTDWRSKSSVQRGHSQNWQLMREGKL
jgi:hypothetical protein